MIECVIDAYEWTGDPVYRAMTTNLLNGFIKNNGSTWTSWNIYNDDIMWAVIAFTRGGVDTGNTNYCNLARANFDACYARAWDGKLGGGFYWSTNTSKNACANGTAAIAAYLLYQIYGDTNYLNKATSLYNWERAVLFNPSTGAEDDNIGTNGMISYWASTYNQGIFYRCGQFFSGRPTMRRWRTHFTMMNLTSGGILPEYGAFCRQQFRIQCDFPTLDDAVREGSQFEKHLRILVATQRRNCLEGPAGRQSVLVSVAASQPGWHELPCSGLHFFI